MTERTPPGSEGIRTAEIIAAVCLATDLGMSFPFEHGFHATLMAMRLSEALEVDTKTAQQTFYACMLIYAGCTTDAETLAETFAGPQTKNIIPSLFGSWGERTAGVLRALPPEDANTTVQTIEILRRLPRTLMVNRSHQTAICEVAEMLSWRLGLPSEICELFPYLTERWDGKNVLRRAKGDEVPLPLRIALVARDAAFQRQHGGEDRAKQIIGERAGHAFDPVIAAVFVDQATKIFAAADVVGSAWDAVLAAEPEPWLMLEGEAVDRALSAVGDFADLISPAFSGHTAGVAQLVSRAAELAGWQVEDIKRIRRAAQVHDVGRVAIDAKVWKKPGPLATDETEQVRLHPYHAERILFRSPLLKTLAEIACDHHEHLDGSGYHRGMTASAMTEAARLLAAADTFHAMTEPRPHRGALPPDEAAMRLADEASRGWLDVDMVSAVIEAAGEYVPTLGRPASLTEREAEVIGLLARGLQTKQMARALNISPKTADTHIQNAYRKIGVSTRAAATLFAMEHGMVHSGEFNEFA